LIEIAAQDTYSGLERPATALPPFCDGLHVIGVSSPNLTTDFLTGSTPDDPDRYSPLAILYNETSPSSRAATPPMAAAPT
jgi:hypothetical protein